MYNFGLYDKNISGGVIVKKNLLSDKKHGKGSKGFYTALGISAVMIGSACIFAYQQGEKLTDRQLKAQQDLEIAEEEAVDRQINDIPKTTTPTYRVTTQPPVVTTTQVLTTVQALTIPASDIIEDEPPVEVAEIYDEPAEAANALTEEESVSAGVQKIENPKAPLAAAGEIIGTFSGTDLVKNETTGSWQTHNGTDIAAEVGAEVYAVSNGEITSVSNDPLWGVTIVLDHHNGFMTRYCNLGADLSVQEGDVVVSGDLLGTVGGTADIESAVAPHLHIEMKHNGSYIDPMSQISQ